MLGLPLSSQYSGSTISITVIYLRNRWLWHQAVYPHDLHYIPIHFSSFQHLSHQISYTCENAQGSLKD